MPLDLRLASRNVSCAARRDTPPRLCSRASVTAMRSCGGHSSSLNDVSSRGLSRLQVGLALARLRQLKEMPSNSALLSSISGRSVSKPSIVSEGYRYPVVLGVEPQHAVQDVNGICLATVPRNPQREFWARVPTSMLPGFRTHRNQMLR